MNQNRAFTLAEVLVTLMIIGVIAAVTIPSLNQNTKKNEYVSGCLKAYSTLNQAINRMKPDYGPIGFGSKWNNKEQFWKDFSAQLNTVEVCSITQRGCFYNGVLKGLNGQADANYSLPNRGEARLRTTDGMSYTYDFGAYLTAADRGLSTENIKASMGRFLVDVNGDKGPNVFGQDVFCFVLVKGKGVLPEGADDVSKCHYPRGSGCICTARVIMDKKIDYPKSSK